MASDQVAAITPGVREVLAAPSDEHWCATWEVSGRSTSWVQITRDEVNFPYAGRDEPTTLLTFAAGSLGVKLELLTWEPEQFATFSYVEPPEPFALARLVDYVFVHVLGCADLEYSVDVKLERLDES